MDRVNSKRAFWIVGGLLAFSLVIFGIYKLTSQESSIPPKDSVEHLAAGSNHDFDETSVATTSTKPPLPTTPQTNSTLEVKNVVKETAVSAEDPKKLHVEPQKGETVTSPPIVPATKNHDADETVVKSDPEDQETFDEETFKVVRSEVPKEIPYNAKVSPLEHDRFASLSKCNHPLDSAEFCQLHLKFINIMQAIIEKGEMSEDDKDKLERAFKDAKSLYIYKTDIKHRLVRHVYIKETGLEAARHIISPPRLKLYLSLVAMEPAAKNRSLKLCYAAYGWQFLFGEKRDSFSALSFKDYELERVPFSNILAAENNFLSRPLYSHLINEFKKPCPSEERLNEIIEWWRGYGLKPIKMEQPKFQPGSVVDIESAKKFACSHKLNSLIKSWVLTKDPKTRAEIENEYNPLITKAFDLPGSFSELVTNYFSPPPFLPVKEAVLDTPPRTLTNQLFCFASSYFQSMANFLPLLEKMHGWNLSRNGPIVEEHKKIIQEVAKPSSSPLSVRNMMSGPFEISNPLSLMLKFLSGSAYEHLAFNQLLGMAVDERSENALNLPSRPSVFFPNTFFYYLTPGMSELESVHMIGPLFVSYLVLNDGDQSSTAFYDPFELPPRIELSVVGFEEPKWYELYSFIMVYESSLAHAVSYVRRANGQWWLCDDLSGNKKVDNDQLPNTAKQQEALSRSHKQRPLVAFYLRTE